MRALWNQCWLAMFIALFFWLFRFVPVPSSMDLNVGVPADSLLLKKHTIQCNLSQAHEHNLQNASGLYSSLTLSTNLRATDRGNRMQARVFYSAILAALVVALLSEEKRGKTDGLQPRTTAVVLSVVTLVMYGLDVHMLELDNRSDLSDRKESYAAGLLLNLPPTDSTWYTFNDSGMRGYFDHADSTHVWRKLKSASRPNIEQYIFYVVPLLLIALWWRHPKRGNSE